MPESGSPGPGRQVRSRNRVPAGPRGVDKLEHRRGRSWSASVLGADCQGTPNTACRPDHGPDRRQPCGRLLWLCARVAVLARLPCRVTLRDGSTSKRALEGGGGASTVRRRGSNHYASVITTDPPHRTSREADGAGTRLPSVGVNEATSRIGIVAQDVSVVPSWHASAHGRSGHEVDHGSTPDLLSDCDRWSGVVAAGLVGGAA